MILKVGGFLLEGWRMLGLLLLLYFHLLGAIHILRILSKGNGAGIVIYIKILR